MKYVEAVLPEVSLSTPLLKQSYVKYTHKEVVQKFFLNSNLAVGCQYYC